MASTHKETSHNFEKKGNSDIYNKRTTPEDMVLEKHSGHKRTTRYDSMYMTG